jgi:vancomycin resistance protein YoaR
MRTPSALRLLVVSFTALTVAGTCFAARPYVLPDTPVLPGVRVDGVAVPKGTDGRAEVHARKEALESRKVTLQFGGNDAFSSTFAELGITVDEEATVARLGSIGHQGSLMERAEAAREASRGEIDVPLVLLVDRDKGAAALEPKKTELDVAPVSAKLDLDKHATIPEKNGTFVDLDATLAGVESLARSQLANLKDVAPFVTVSVPPRVSKSFVDSLDVSTVVSEFETHFSRGGDQARRGKNIDVAAGKLEGLILSPGQLVSFNEIVGERSEANGFQKSWEIFKGEMVEGVGGGTCQVASTFHAAVFFGGLDVLERLPHSRPSAYIPMGLDSTVVYPAVDLKVRNPHPFPVVVHTKVGPNTLRVELLGKTKPARVTFGRDVVATLAYKRKVTEEANLPSNRVVIKQRGIKGYRIKRSRTLVYTDGTKKVEESTDFYPPTTEIYLVPTGFDESKLPALPAGEDGGDSDAPAAKPSTAGAVACAGDCEKPADVEFVNGRGVHELAPGQVAPAKSVYMKH